MATVRELVFGALIKDPELNVLGIDANHVWSKGSVEGPQPTPFVVIAWGNVERGFGPVNSAECTLYVHDDIGNYDTINAIVMRLRSLMESLAASGPSANWIIDVRWQGDSGELSDDSYKTNMRNASFNVVANTL